MDAFVTSVTTGISDISTTAMGAMGTVVPYGIPIVGAFIILGVVLRAIKKVTSK